jgi:hypothetical protein
MCPERYPGEALGTGIAKGSYLSIHLLPRGDTAFRRGLGQDPFFYLKTGQFLVFMKTVDRVHPCFLLYLRE